jgi:glycosyltransferase involved in cell wall biosynthesis
MVNPLFHPYQGGTEKHVFEVCKRIAGQHDVTVLTARLPGTKKKERLQGINVVRTRAWIIKKAVHPLPPPFPIAPQMALKIREQAKKNDLMHFHNRFTYSLLDFKIVKMEEKKLCMTLHNSRPQGIDAMTDLVGGAYDDLMGKKMMEQCDHVAAVSRATLEETVPRALWKKSSVIYNGVNLEDYNPGVDSSKTVKQHGDFFFCVCRFVPQKGLEFLLDAMKKVDAKLVLLGRGPLEKKLEKNAGKDVEIITRRVSEEELAALYGGCRAFVLPSLYEPFGMVIVEAMAMKKPVVATSVGGIPEIITPETGFLVPPRDPNALAEKMNHVLKNPEKTSKMGVKGRERVEQNFTWDHTAKSYLKLYEKLS